MPQQPDPLIRYSAFISYNHRDLARARRLQAGLETYRMPRRLVGQPGSLGQVPARLLPVCRDRDELAAAPDLSDAIREALAASASLIVVCSPHTDSPWVRIEIETFRALYPSRPILAALFDGPPEASIPASMFAARPDGSSVHPLAADFQETGDGPRLALLKLIAELAGVRLDALVRRDAQRRMRRIGSAAAAGATAAMALGGAAFVTINARDAAAAQHGKTGSPLEFLQTDLRRQLRQSGGLAALDAVNKRALSYYAGQDLDRLPDADRAQVAKLLQAKAADDETMGKTADARAACRRAATLTAGLLAAAPDRGDRIFGHAQSMFCLGYGAWRDGDAKIAEARFRDYLVLADRLVEIDPANGDWRIEQGYANTNLGMLAFRQYGDGRTAEGYFSAALGSFRTATTARAAAKFDSDIADTLAWLADSQRIQGRYEDAFRSRGRQQAIVASLLTAQPRNVELQADLVASELGVARIEAASGRPAAAAARVAAAHRTAAALFAGQPDNADLARQVRVLVLFAHRFQLAAAGGSPRADPAAAPADCRNDAALDAELGDFCRLIEGLAKGTAGATEVAGVIAARKARGSARLSPRWGIDFADEARLAPRAVATR